MIARRLLKSALIPTLILCMPLGACEDTLIEPEGFIAIITRAEGPVEVSPGESWTVRVVELSGTLGIDTTALVSPNDTLILTVPPASYDISVDGVPVTCANRFGPRRRAVLSEGGQTFTVRYNYECGSLLVVETATDGWDADDGFVYRVVDSQGRAQTGFAAPTDTVRFDGLEEGEHTVELANVASNCVVTNDGGRIRTVDIEAPFSRVVSFRVRCVDEEYSPEVLHFASSYREGVGVFYLEATDPGGNPLTGGGNFPDIDRYAWNLTDCNRNSILGGPALYPKTGFEGRGLASPQSRSAGADTVRIVMVLPTGLPDGDVHGNCAAIRVEDRQANTTDIVEEPLGNEHGRAPDVARFNAFFTETVAASWLEFDVQATDVDGDYAGAFIRFTWKDGTFGRADGQPDQGSYGVQGFPGTEVVPLLMQTQTFQQPFEIQDVLSVTLFAVDREGNFTEVVDNDPVH